MTGDILEDVHYYNNRMEIQNGCVTFDRVYMIDGYKFTEDDCVRLEAIYSQLPGYLADAGYPYWFGQDEDGIYLWASPEPSGLQFCGRVNMKDFINWETQWHMLLAQADFPFKQI